MPILNLENPAFISVDGAGRPNAGGTVEVYEADGLFTTLATVYSDQVKTTELTNPVTLDDAGTKEIWYDVKVDIREVFANGSGTRDTLNLDPNASQASVQGFNLAQNGSFEVDATSDGQPDNWTITPYSGSAIAITESVVRHGTKALEFNTAGAGSGGGTATSAKFPVTEGGDLSVSWSFYANNATTTNTFLIYWYDEDDAASATPSTTLTMPASGSVPTSWTEYAESITVPSDATQGQIVLTGIASGGSNLTSKAYFDGISVISYHIHEDLHDSSGVKTIESAGDATPVNWLKVTNGDTGVAPIIESAGDGTDTDVDLDVQCKGTGTINLLSTTEYGSGDEIHSGAYLFYATSAVNTYAGSGSPLQFSTEVFDPQGDYDPTTNYRYTPSKAGYYLVTMSMDTDSNGIQAAFVYKNGAATTIGTYKDTTDTDRDTGSCTGIVSMNGSTDYIDIRNTNIAFVDKGSHFTAHGS